MAEGESVIAALRGEHDQRSRIDLIWRLMSFANGYVSLEAPGLDYRAIPEVTPRWVRCPHRL
jgi:hypothetical protein